ncbi:hypothetical protein [Paenibacillus apiarius]|uniref:hypothetical protein n=1 Tax=Paenibacillus apiarius TaxID=46240 RepID=UPI003B3B7FA8
MANRNTLHVKKLDAFKEWLTSDGWEIKQPKGDYEVLRAVKAGRKPLLVFERGKNGLTHLTVQESHTGVLWAFIKSIRQEGKQS